MFGSELPSWRQIFTNKYNKKERGHFCGNSDDLIWTSQTAISVRLIIENYQLVMERDVIRLWLPDFFCAETEQLFKKDKIQIDYYPITEKFEPDWKILKKMAAESVGDIFVFVHYFGVYHDINIAKEFCKRNDMLLIEDCAHVLYSSGKFGVKGDFTVYSPHKILPVCDGGIIRYNEKDERIQKVVDGIKKQLEEEVRAGNCVSWRVKKALQKIIKVRRSTVFKVGPHFSDEKAVTENEVRLGISRWSYNTLSGYSYTEIKKIAFTRKMNLDTMNYIVDWLLPEAEPVMTDDVVCPYAALYSIEKIKDKQGAVKKLERAGLLVTFWPTLPGGIKQMKDKSIAADMSENLLVIPIHQGMTPQYMLNRYLPGIKKEKTKYRFEKLSGSMGEREIWENMKDIVRNNIPQDWVYGVTKSEIEKKDLCRYRIYNFSGDCIGMIQALIEKRHGIKYAVRVNRGPIMIKKYNVAEIIFQVMDQFRKMMRPLPFFYAPNLEFTPYHMHLACSYGWKCWNRFGFPSGTMNLEESEEALRKKLDSKWRNQLTAAEKKKLTVRNDNAGYKEFLKIYRTDQKEKGYVGIPEAILNYLFDLEDSPLESYYVEDEAGKVMAFDIIYCQCKTAHYLVGWNSNEGRKLYLNNLLLFNVVISLKQKGIKQFDLGGIEYIHTEDVARFKDGMRPEKYQLMGEFVR